MERHFDVPDDRRLQREKYLSDRWLQLNTLGKEWGDRAAKYLLMTNAGGAIAMLSFLGTYDKALSILAVKVALTFFLAGIVVAGVWIAFMVHHLEAAMTGIDNDTGSLYRHEIDYATVIARDNERTGEKKRRLILPYLSFSCFIAGCSIGSYTLFAQITG